MAKKRGSSRSTSRPGFGTPPVPSGHLSGLLVRLRAAEYASNLIKAMEDRRRWNPYGSIAPAAAVSRSSRRLTPSGKSAGLFPTAGLSFSVPQDVAVCVRRKERRETIFAQRKAGKGARAPRRRSRFSDIGC